MLKIWKFGGITLGAGAVIGLSVVGWLWSTRPDVTVVDSKGGSVGLLDGPSPSPDATSDGLHVTAPAETNSSGGVLGTTATGASGSTGTSDSSGGSGGTSGSGSGSSGGSATLPGPEGFAQYEKLYPDHDKGAALDIRVGTGVAVVAGNTVSVNYRGWLTNGTEFDQSYTRGDNGQPKPFVFKQGAGSVISGWDQGVIGMKVGGKRRLVLGSNLGYGAQGQGSIPPNAMLIFDIELLGVQ